MRQAVIQTEIHHIMTEHNVLKAIETLASGTMKVYGLPSDKVTMA